jgi:hypothetical protein
VQRTIPHATGEGGTFGCENLSVTIPTKHVRLSDPEVGGLYHVVERRADGSLLLRPWQERLSDVHRVTQGAVFQDEEFIAHLERVAAADDDLPPDRRP